MTTKSSGAHAFNLLLNSLRQSGSLIETPFHSDDKRRAARYVAQLPVRYRWPDGDNWFNGLTGNISATGLLCVLDHADLRIIRDRPAPPDDPLELVLALRTTLASSLPASVSCSARYVRTVVGAERIVFNAIGVAVYTWQLGKTP